MTLPPAFHYHRITNKLEPLLDELKHVLCTLLETGSPVPPALTPPHLNSIDSDTEIIPHPDYIQQPRSRTLKFLSSASQFLKILVHLNEINDFLHIAQQEVQETPAEQAGTHATRERPHNEPSPAPPVPKRHADPSTDETENEEPASKGRVTGQEGERIAEKLHLLILEATQDREAFAARWTAATDLQENLEFNIVRYMSDLSDKLPLLERALSTTRVLLFERGFYELPEIIESALKVHLTQTGDDAFGREFNLGMSPLVDRLAALGMKVLPRQAIRTPSLGRRRRGVAKPPDNETADDDLHTLLFRGRTLLDLLREFSSLMQGDAPHTLDERHGALIRAIVVDEIPHDLLWKIIRAELAGEPDDPPLVGFVVRLALANNLLAKRS